ncbi:MAG: aldo/keto reductase [Actinobacteria bacterium]|nr:aldo/keto reductase [Actinomycetota bacterium]
MDFRNLGRTGVKVSPLCLGCWMFGYRTREAEALPIIDAALAAGLNFLDTANAYGRGASEEIVGRALKRNGQRPRVVLATKVRNRMADDDPNALGTTRRHIIEQCEQSLRRLQTDWIDLYQIHSPASDTPIDETLRALDDLVHAGKVRYLGTSVFAAWQIVESLWAAKELGLNRFVCEQPPYHLLDRRIERELVPMARTYGIALIPWSPLAGGMLTGKYQRGQMPPAESRFERHPEQAARRQIMSDRAFDVVDVVRAIASEKGCTPSQLALAWNMAQPGVTSPIVGPRTLDQLHDNLGALSVSVSAEDRARLDAVAPPGRAIAPFYQPWDWGPHPHRW